MKKTLLLSLTFLGAIVSSEVNLYAKDIFAAAEKFFSEGTVSQSFENNIVREVDENISKTISNINNKLKKESGKSFWATEEKWNSSINTLKELVVIASDVTSTTDEQLTNKYNKMVERFRAKILSSISSNSETAITDASSAVVSWMVYSALYKRFHDKIYTSDRLHSIEMQDVIEENLGGNTENIDKLFTAFKSVLGKIVSDGDQDSRETGEVSAPRLLSETLDRETLKSLFKMFSGAGDNVGVTTELFLSVISDVKKSLQGRVVSNSIQNIDVWELLCEQNSGKNSFINILANDWYCYLSQLNVISFGTHRNESTTGKVILYKYWISELQRKCAGRICVKNPKFINDSKMPLPEELAEHAELLGILNDVNVSSFNKRCELLARGYTATNVRCEKVIRHFAEKDDTFKKAFSEFNALRIRQSLPGLTKDIYNKEYLYFMTKYLDFLDDYKGFEDTSRDKIFAHWLSTADFVNGVSDKPFDLGKLNAMLKNYIELSDGKPNDKDILNTIDLIPNLVTLSRKYNIEEFSPYIQELAPILQKCNVRVEDFLSKIDVKAWNDPNRYLSARDELIVISLLEIFYNRSLNKEEKELIHKKISGFTCAADLLEGLNTEVKFLCDCNRYGIDFLKVLPDLAGTYRVFKYDIREKPYIGFIDQKGDLRIDRIRLATLYKLNPSKFDVLFPDEQFKDKRKLKLYLTKISTESNKIWSKVSRDESVLQRKTNRFYPERIVTPSFQTKPIYKFVNSNN